MRWSEFVARREVRRQHGLSAARVLRAEGGGADPATVLPSWRIARSPSLCARVLEVLAGARPRPDSRALGAVLAPGDRLDPIPESEDLAEQVLRRRYEARDGWDDADPLAWALAELEWIGAELEARDRVAWATTRYRPDPVADAAATRLWSSWFAGDPWSCRRECDRAWLPVAVGVFRGVLEARRIPPHVRDRALADLREAFFFALLSGEKDGDVVALPGWAALAVRVVETGAPGPVDAVAGVLRGESWGRVARCATTRGQFAAATAELFANRPDALARTVALERLLPVEGSAESVLDAVLIFRLARGWARAEDTAPEASWAVATQNRGRARARLRAIVAERQRPELRTRLLSLDALHARTQAALSRFAWSWAWQQLALDFAFDDDRGATPRCEDVPAGLEPLGPSDAEAARTWILLVVLRGRLAHLGRWVRDGSTGDRDTTWGRLLSDEAPAAVRDPVREGRRAATWRRLRSWLSDHLADELDALWPRICQFAALSPGRALARDAARLLEPGWEASVAFPRSGFPTMLENARAAVAQREAP